MKEITSFLPEMHVFVCVNDRTIIQGVEKASCGPKSNSETVKEIKKWLTQEGLITKIQVTKTKCLGHCHKEGGVVCVYPQKKFYKEVTSINDIKKIINGERKNLTF
jgi:(2Fe-2S) ferredoxin